MNNSLDVIIIGAGPIGLACAIEAKRKNLNYAVFEKGRLVNSIVGYPYYMRFFSSSNLLEIGGIPFIIESEKPSRFESLEYYRRVALAHELNIHLQEPVLEVEGEKGNFVVETKKGDYSCSCIICAAGYFDRPRLLDIPGETLPKVTHYYREPHLYSGQDLLIIGSGNSAVEAALETHRHGARVTIAVRGEEFKSGVKYWIRPDMENRIKNKEITAYFNTKVKEIFPDHVHLENNEGRQLDIVNDNVLALTGYKPDFDFLQRIGIIFRDDEFCTPVYDPETNESSRKGIYLAGVVLGGLRTDQWFIENSREHAKTIFRAF